MSAMIDERRRNYLSGRLLDKAERLALSGRGYQIYIPSRNPHTPVPFIIVSKGSGVFYIDCVDEDGLCVSVPVYDTIRKLMKAVMLGRVDSRMSSRSTIPATDENIERIFAMREIEGGKPLFPYINLPMDSRYVFFGDFGEYRQFGEKEHPLIPFVEYRRLRTLPSSGIPPKNASDPLSEAIRQLNDRLPF